jgi:hypothetical protein
MKRLTLEYQGSKCLSYWQSVLRFGLPLSFLSRSVDYLGFRMASHNSGLRYPWPPAKVIMDVAFIFLLAALWRGVMREMVAAKQKKAAGLVQTTRP